LENRRKTIIESSRSVFKRKNKAKEGGALGSGVKKEHENTKARDQKMMRGESGTIYSANIGTCS
jgi:hypothetical protein